MLPNYEVRPVWLALLMGLSIVLFGSLSLLEQGVWTSAPEVEDGPDYDNIAYNVAKWRGFGFQWSDPEWRAPY